MCSSCLVYQFDLSGVIYFLRCDLSEPINTLAVHLRSDSVALRLIPIHRQTESIYFLM